MMTDRDALICINLTGEIGKAGLGKIISCFGSPVKALGACEKKLADAGLPEAACRAMAHFDARQLERELKLARDAGVSIITLLDDDYPYNLRNIFDPPLVLYVKGALKREDAFSVAMVGSRRATFYGLSNASRLAADLVRSGFTVVSGMARGIDTYAHLGALKAKGRTIAFMGSGFHHVYPKENRSLAMDIAKDGSVVTEFSMDTPPLKQNFPRRNRLISGMSLGTVVVEAARNSGALITADFALEQGKDVFCVPGQIDSFASSGTNELIQQGAKLVCSIEDVLEELPLPVTRPTAQAARPKGGSLVPLEQEEILLYDIISDEGVTFDELLDSTGMTLPGLARLLLKLELGRVIRREPGNRYLRN